MLKASAIISLLSVAATAYPVLPAGMSWANLAWGFSGGGRDSTTNVNLVLVDPDATSANDIAKYKANGRIVMCYLSAGTIEKSRADYIENQAAWDAVLLGQMADWNETWIDIRQLNAVMPLVEKRMDKLVAKGCQAVEPDNIDCYDNTDCWKKMNGVTSGSAVEGAQITYCQQLATAAHSRNLAIVIKNAAAIVPTIAKDFDGAITESCVGKSECDVYKTWLVDHGKAHFAVEYNGDAANCKKAYPKMMMKYCPAESGGNLCLDEVNQWINCGTNTSNSGSQSSTSSGSSSTSTGSSESESSSSDSSS